MINCLDSFDSMLFAYKKCFRFTRGRVCVSKHDKEDDKTYLQVQAIYILIIWVCAALKGRIFRLLGLV